MRTKTTERDPAHRIQTDMLRYKRERNTARTELETARNTICQLQAQVAAAMVAGLLARPEYLFDYIGLKRVLTADGMVDPGKVQREVADLLRRRPELGVLTPGPSTV